jgi:tetratricopeptide (TPR) repeat protein
MIAFNKTRYPEPMTNNINLEGYSSIVTSVANSSYRDNQALIDERKAATNAILDSLKKIGFSSLSRNENDEYLTAKQTWTLSSLGNFSEAEKSYDRAIEYYDTRELVIFF